MNVTISNEQKIRVTLAPTTASGQPATVDGAPRWEVTSGDATVEPSEDGLSAYLISGTSVGASTIQVIADADLGEGVREISDTIDLTVVAPEAVGLGLTVGTAEPK